MTTVVIEKKEKKKTKRGLTREFLTQRYNAVMADPSVKERDPLTLSTIWYRLRPKFKRAGIHIPKEKQKDTRRMIEYEYIRDICKDELGVKRAELGIHTAARPQVYDRGEVYDISLNNIEDLAEKGVDLVPI